MQHTEFLIIARKLFDESWAFEISRRLSINIRTVKRWGSGSRPIPKAVAGIMRFWAGSANEEE